VNPALPTNRSALERLFRQESVGAHDIGLGFRAWLLDANFAGQHQPHARDAALDIEA